mmetsp:Transcript_70725/g.216784  ORF Transcript_70725/g.216784 Transcript_70725/m.216784 type:complete len:322 (+) Transcript_70725:503-1468(+)
MSACAASMAASMRLRATPRTPRPLCVAAPVRQDVLWHGRTLAPAAHRRPESHPLARRTLTPAESHQHRHRAPPIAPMPAVLSQPALWRSTTCPNRGASAVHGPSPLETRPTPCQRRYKTAASWLGKLGATRRLRRLPRARRRSVTNVRAPSEALSAPTRRSNERPNRSRSPSVSWRHTIGTRRRPPRDRWPSACNLCNTSTRECISARNLQRGCPWLPVPCACRPKLPKSPPKEARRRLRRRRTSHGACRGSARGPPGAERSPPGGGRPPSRSRCASPNACSQPVQSACEPGGSSPPFHSIRGTVAGGIGRNRCFLGPFAD